MNSNTNACIRGLSFISAWGEAVGKIVGGGLRYLGKLNGGGELKQSMDKK